LQKKFVQPQVVMEVEFSSTPPVIEVACDNHRLVSRDMLVDSICKCVKLLFSFLL
jgi:hypothetical protein